MIRETCLANVTSSLSRGRSTRPILQPEICVVGVVTCFVFVFVSFYLFFKLVEVTMGNRVSAEVELEGLDIPEMGALAYPDFVLGPGTPMGGGVTATIQKAAAGAPALTPARAEQ